MGKQKVHEVKFDLEAEDAENLWGLVSGAQVANLDPDTSVPWAVYELRLTLEECRQIPDDDEDLYPRGSKERAIYCSEDGLSNEFFPKTMTWVVPRRLLKILKLILKAAVVQTTGATFAMLVELCKTVRLSAWFRATFKKPINVDLGEDDRDLDDEIDLDKEPSVDPETQTSLPGNAQEEAVTD